MVTIIKGQTVKLYEKTKVDTDPFGAPIFNEEVVDVENVLITPTTAEDIVNEMQIYGKHSVYTLSIPKGDIHIWDNCVVEFWGKKFIQFGPVTEYQEELVPLNWNKKVKVELYE